MIDSFLQELHPLIFGEFKNFSVFHTFSSHLCSYRIETWYIVYCFVLKSYSSCFDVIEYFLPELNPLLLEKSLNLTVFWIFFFFYIFAALTMKLVYRFVVKSYSSSSLFSWIDLLFFTKVDGRIMPRLRCSCFQSYGSWTSKNSNNLQFPFIFFAQVADIAMKFRIQIYRRNI